MPDITAPSVSLAALAPLLFVFGAACVGVLVEAFAPRDTRHPVQVGVALEQDAGRRPVHGALVPEQHVQRGQDDADRREDGVDRLDRERADEHEELAGEAVGAR